ncbi:SMI1/KNR4 family protein [Clostridium sp. JS66]|uniref:SMI1/KNR4 family protein n=1 Tax=Clostridium sp. JS66 TaxID=3064705 RepID=UPI00298D6908|nr:SMI1/KNR4 family protein [Clostridium sp. JS66]WPC42735.1 SMI1/KNR4 family protein [Clostridium sp. JS66]
MKIKEDSIILPLPGDEVISSFEEYCGVKLPKEYKEFLKINNGAIPKTNTFNYEGREYLIERFLCLLESPESDDFKPVTIKVADSFAAFLKMLSK